MKILHRAIQIAVFGTLSFAASGRAWAQDHHSSPNAQNQAPTKQPNVQGSGTAGTIPIWTGGSTVGDSHIQDNGVTLSITEPISGAVSVSGGVTTTDNTGDVAVLGGNSGVGVSGSSTGGDGVEGFSSAANGVRGTTASQAAGVKGICGATLPCRGVEAFSPDEGVSSWGRLLGVQGVSDTYGVVGIIRDSGNLVSPPAVPGTQIVAPATQVGVVGNCGTSTGAPLANNGCIGIYGYGNAASGFAHGIVGETDFSNGAGVVGITHTSGPIGFGQGVLGGADTANGIGVVGYNTAGGFAIQSQGDMRVFGNVYVQGNVIPSSSRRLKTNIEPMHGALDKVERLRCVTFNWNETGKPDIGLVAEEVAGVVPEVVGYDKNGVDVQGVDYSRLTALLIEAVKEQQAEIKQLQSLVDRLNGPK